MILFFRKIRQKLLTNNKLSKYLLYALGEILLVVIGILIALQINNWNENKKLDSIRTSNCHQLLEDLKADSIYINEKIKEFNASISLYSAYLKSFEIPRLTMNDVMNNQNELDFVTTTIRFQNSTIVSLLNTGEIKLFSPDLRKKLISFKRDQDYLVETNNEWNQNYFDRIENAGIYGSQPHFQSRIRNQTLLKDKLGIEDNLDKIIWSIEIAMLYKNLNERNKIRHLKELQEYIAEITQLIKEELSK